MSDLEHFVGESEIDAVHIDTSTIAFCFFIMFKSSVCATGLVHV